MTITQRQQLASVLGSANPHDGHTHTHTHTHVCGARQQGLPQARITRVVVAKGSRSSVVWMHHEAPTSPAQNKGLQFPTL